MALLADVLCLHVEEFLHGGVRERYHLDRLLDDEGDLAAVLRADEVRRRRCLSWLEAFAVAMPPCADRDALGALPSADAARVSGGRVEVLCDGFWQPYACEHVDLVIGFFCLLNPGFIAAASLSEVEWVYAELEEALRPAAL